ncbi:MAG: Uma2 family endonuclease [Gemmataceae bacterium]
MPSTLQAQTPSSLLSVAGFRKITPKQYHKLMDSGIIYEGEPIELLEGYLVEKGMRNPPHDGAVTRLSARLPRFLPGAWILRVQCAISLNDSEPEPDGAVVRGDETSYDTRLPEASDFGIVIEVSDSTLAFDRLDKGRIYARAGIPEYWIINIPDRQIEVYTQPDVAADPPKYASRVAHPHGSAFTFQLDGQVVSITVADFLP